MTTMDLEKLAEEKSPANRAPGLQRISRISMRALHIGEQRDRSRDSVSEAQVEGRRHRFHRLRMEVDGYFADSAVTVPVGNIKPELQKLLDVTRDSLDRAIEKMRAGNRLGDVGHAVQSLVEENGFR